MNFAGVTGGAEFGSIGEIISKLIAPIFVLAGMVALLFLIWGGIRYMTARGDPKAVESAKGVITSAIIGVLIVLFSATLFYFFSASLNFDIFSSVSFSTTVHAQVNIGDTVLFGSGTIGDAFSNIGELFTNIIRLALFIAALVFLAMIIWGGLRYLNAGGDPKNADAARSTLTNAVIGLLIVLLSLAIIEIITRLAGVSIF